MTGSEATEFGHPKRIRALLASNSTNPGRGYLDHLEDPIQRHFSESRSIAFVPYAMGDLDSYARTAKERFRNAGLETFSIHATPEPAAALAEADGIFVGGGNTFRLLDLMIRLGLIDVIRRLVAEGVPYLGTSAGTNVACPTIMTTNDMPIARPQTFDALGLVDFQINPHYVDRDPDIPHGGETREQRIAEYLEEHATPVLGLREGSWLAVHTRIELCGPHSARLFRRGQSSVEVEPGPLTIHI